MILDKYDELGHILLIASAGGRAGRPDAISGTDVIGERDTHEEATRAHRRIFDALIHGREEEFLAACDEGLVVTAHGSSPVPTRLTKGDIPGLDRIVAGAHTDLPAIFVRDWRVTKDTASVVLRHSFGRNGVDYLLEMANVVVLRDGLVVEWSSYPIDLAEYSRAWRTRDAFLMVRREASLSKPVALD